jgi:hypothetical protein
LGRGWGGFFKNLTRQKKRKRKKRKMQKVQRGFFLEKMGPTGLIMRGKKNLNSPYLEYRFPQIAKFIGGILNLATSLSDL